MAEADYDPFTPSDFVRQDESDDSLFYLYPRLVVHIDEQAIAVIGELFEEVFSAFALDNGADASADTGDRPAVPGKVPVILDLMSSWRSHWPSSRPAHHGGLIADGGRQGDPSNTESEKYSEDRPAELGKTMVGLGLNGVEMGENPDLGEYVVHDVNKDPRLPFDDGRFDGVVITVSIQYLTRPVEVFRDVNRVLKPGGIFLVIFSNRMFATKAVRAWMVRNDEQRKRLVAAYFLCAGNYQDIRVSCRNPDRGPYDDPVYVVMARKPAHE